MNFEPKVENIDTFVFWQKREKRQVFMNFEPKVEKIDTFVFWQKKTSFYEFWQKWILTSFYWFFYEY